MKRRGSLNHPEFRHRTESQSSAMRRKSISEEYPKPSIGGAVDLLLDPLYNVQSLQVGNHPDSPIHNVRQILEAYPDESPPLYTEMLNLHQDNTNKDKRWKQVAKWQRFEQSVEGDDTRFSKPHITLLSVLGLVQLKHCLRMGVIILDTHARSFVDIADTICAAWLERGLLNHHNELAVKDLLRMPKYHLIGRIMKSAAEIRKDNLDEKAIIKRPSSQTGENDDEVESTSDIISKEMKKIPAGTQGAIILTGVFNLLDNPVSALVRLDKQTHLFPELPNLPLPVRFVFVLLTPCEHYASEIKGIGRTMGALFSDEIFRKVAIYSLEPYTIADAIEEFFAQTVAIPPGICNTDSRWEPNDAAEQVPRSVGMLYASYGDPFDDEPMIESKESHSDIVRSGKCMGGLYDDIKRKVPCFVSDFTDFFRGRLSQSLAATIFVFFANITSIITFGAVMERALHHQMAAIENILCGGISGVIFALFSGQPLNILSATGPTLVFEVILFDFCVSNGWDFLPFRFWVAVWIAVVLLILVATDMSALVGLITRFTEEAFATLISMVFIIQSFEKLIEISHDAPIITNPKSLFESPCVCYLNDPVASGNSTVRIKLADIDAAECASRGGEAVGLQCHFKPDVYMLSILLTFGTFTITYGLNLFRNTAFFSSKIRNSVSDFGVFIAIVLMTATSYFVGIELPVLNIPTSLRPTLDRAWLINPGGVPWQVSGIAIFPAIFYTILIVMDQQITAVIINRKDNKLRKGYGYHLDLLVIAILIVICGALGLPFYVAATVLSVMHVDSLRLQSETMAPGEKAQFLGIKEQRLTAVLAHVLIGSSVFLTPIIKLVPLPVLIGVFLYMGVVSMLGLQFVQRIAMLFMPLKHQPDYAWVRLVRMKRVHLYTFIQILSIVALFAVKYTQMISMMFPLMLVFMVILRMFVLNKIFTKQELLSLDDPVPAFSALMQPVKRSRKGQNLPEELETLKEIEDGRKSLDEK